LFCLLTTPAIGQNQLQNQLIMLQSEVIAMLHEGLLSGRIRDINRLYNASELAREGSLGALRDQHQRMLQAAPLRRPPGFVRRASSTPSLAPPWSRRQPPPPAAGTKPARSRTERAEAFPSNASDDGYESGPGTGAGSTSGTKAMLLAGDDAAAPLFCRYALDLQRTGEPLDARFRAGGPQACPECGTRVEVQPGRAWRITRDVLSERALGQRFEAEAVEERTYLLGNRFVVKCHREGAGFACVLCSAYRHRDTVCATAEGLVRHVWREHQVGEYEGDVDIREVCVARERTSKRY
jgi:hypothetical protein